MLQDTTVLGVLSSQFTEGQFTSSWANLIAGWAVDYYREYEAPPEDALVGLFESWADACDDDEKVDMVGRYVNQLLDMELESINSQYIIDTAGELLNRVKLQRLAESIMGDLDRGKLVEAEARVVDFNRVDLGGGSGVDVLSNEAALKAAFDDKREPLIKYGGALGEFFDEHMERDGFIAFLGPEKRGKSWWLIDTAWRAINQKRRVAVFSVGDMSEAQMIRRLAVRASRAPMKAGPVQYPTGIERDYDSEMATVERGVKHYEHGLTWRTAMRAYEKLVKRKLGGDGQALRLSTHPSSSLSVRGIKGILQTWERRGWVPDVVVVDYADILDMPDGGNDLRHRINESWKQLRALSQTYHCLVVTATQADASAHQAAILGAGNFSEDKRKLSHVTGMVGINATKDEKPEGIQRLNWIVLREGSFSETKCVNVAGCFALGNPAVKSTW
jgi:hypothetical protein